MAAETNNHRFGSLKRHIYSLIVLEVGSLKWLSLGQSQGVEKVALGEDPLLAFEVVLKIHSLRFLANGPFLHSRRQHLSIFKSLFDPSLHYLLFCTV